MHGANVRKVEVFALQHLQCSAVVAALLVATLLHHLLLALLLLLLLQVARIRWVDEAIRFWYMPMSPIETVSSAAIVAVFSCSTHNL